MELREVCFLKLFMAVPKAQAPFFPGLLKDRPAQSMGQDRERFSFSVLLGQPLQEVLARRVAPQEEHGGFREGPL